MPAAELEARDARTGGQRSPRTRPSPCARPNARSTSSSATRKPPTRRARRGGRGVLCQRGLRGRAARLPGEAQAAVSRALKAALICTRVRARYAPRVRGLCHVHRPPDQNRRARSLGSRVRLDRRRRRRSGQSSTPAGRRQRSPPRRREPRQERRPPLRPAAARGAARCPFPPIVPEQRRRPPREALWPGRKLIALTFDLCEQPGEVAGYDGAIVDYLRKENVKATFFAGGKWLRSHEERARQLMADPLFEIGNHSEAHRNLRGARGRPPARRDPRARSVPTRRSARACADAMRHATRPPPMSAGCAAHARCSASPTAPAIERALQRGARAGPACDPVGLVNGRSLAGRVGRGHRARDGGADAPGSIIVNHANGRGWHTAAAFRLRSRSCARWALSS